jgi:hypothetical protein
MKAIKPQIHCNRLSAYRSGTLKIIAERDPPVFPVGGAGVWRVPTNPEPLLRKTTRPLYPKALNCEPECDVFIRLVRERY